MKWKSAIGGLVLILSFLNELSGQIKRDTTSKGLPYEIFTANNGKRIEVDDIITFHFIQKTEAGMVLSSTYTSGIPVKTQVKAPLQITDLMEFLLLLTEKDSAMVKVPSDSIFQSYENSRPPFIPKGSWVVLVVKIEKVQTLKEVLAEAVEEVEKLRSQEAVLLEKYLKDHQLKPTYTDSGLGYIITKKSVKRKPTIGDTVYVNYTARTLDGKVIDTSIESEAKKAGLNQPGREYGPVSFVAGMGEVIQGWDEALLLMNEGSEALLIIPSKLAFGYEGSGDVIGPFTPIVIRVELVKIMSPQKQKGVYDERKM